ncbi:hypothetical protein KNT81_gp069 [Proteus phage phiP4-3]|uniref:Uncharacterized protein n=1 Tax=Proteus phage phiP4-3 TaxID=2065203 RepID=A0A2I6PFD5_9CAUD|nr:hypothetical protein KNT81_gp069 [Proteus phage phiP4-3]AUM58427.1 hypothetical protein phiP43_069 [Proteus phage phiP4-3]AZV01328.1 hypothetical protein vBSdyM006_191 [Shigella phage vB_SdyM_006]QQV89530.1 hypothetical protein SJ_112 [Proteus phage SJ_PmiM]
MFDLYLYVLAQNHLTALSELGLTLTRVESDSDNGLMISLAECKNKEQKIKKFWKRFPTDYENFLEEIGE